MHMDPIGIWRRSMDDTQKKEIISATIRFNNKVDDLLDELVFELAQRLHLDEGEVRSTCEIYVSTWCVN